MVSTQILPNSSRFIEGYLESLLKSFSDWAPTTTIINQNGCVFEYQGVFPKGCRAGSYFNLEPGQHGFCGHIPFSAVASIHMHENLHHNRASHAICFMDKKKNCLFKVLLGRDSSGQIFKDQLDEFEKIKIELMMIGYDS